MMVIRRLSWMDGPTNSLILAPETTVLVFLQSTLGYLNNEHHISLTVD